MPAPIVYHGRPDKPNSNNLLFSGIKFWLSMRVPSRPHFIQKLQVNGGEVVNLERLADILIADDAAPKRAPVGWDSYSWKFIDAAIAKGELPDKENYRISRPGEASTIRQLGRSTRTPFTPEDDRVLTECARRQLGAPQGTGVKGSLKGNAFWEEFAENHPRHTASSWRERWLKRLATLPGNDQPWEAVEAETTGTRATATVDKQRLLGPSQQRAPTCCEPDTSIRKTNNESRQRFTDADDTAIIEAVDEARRLGGNIGGKLFYQDFAKTNPSHSAESWRSHYHRVLAPRLHQDRRPEPVPLKSPASANSPASIEFPETQETPSAAEETYGEDGQRDPDLQAGNDEPEAEPSRPDSHGSHHHQPTGSASGGGATTPDPEPSHEDCHAVTVPGAAVDVAEECVSEEDLPDSSSPETTRESFFRDLSVYVEVCGDTIDTEPIIAGVQLDLYKLYLAVEAQNVSLEECDWIKVCLDMGVASSNSGRVQDCYRANLQDFIESMRSFEDEFPENDTAGQEQHPQIESAADDVPTQSLERDEPDGEDLLDGHSDQSSSSPLLVPPQKSSVLKRPRDFGFEIPRKRVRISRDLEIPDSPRPARFIPPPVHRSSPIDLDEEDAFLPSAQTTPSRQELPESLCDEPIPINLPLSRQRNAPGKARGSLPARPRPSTTQTTPSSGQRFASVSQKPATSGRITNTSAQISLSSERGRPLAPAAAPAAPAFREDTHLFKDSLVALIQPDILHEILSSPRTRHRSQSNHATAAAAAAPRTPQRPSHPRASSRVTPGAASAERWAAMGYGAAFVARLLHATSGDAGLAGKILDAKARRSQQPAKLEGIPHMKGVWTAEDDRKLRLIDGFDPAASSPAARAACDTAERALKLKHGFVGALDDRRRYLSRCPAAPDGAP